MTNQHSQVYLCFTNIAFCDQNSAPICAVANAVVHVLLRCAHGMTDKQFVYADCTVFLTRKYTKTRYL